MENGDADEEADEDDDADEDDWPYDLLRFTETNFAEGAMN
jgi:hypothetical protein